MQRAVVALFYFEDRPMTEIAHILSIFRSDRLRASAPGTQKPR